MKFEGWVKLKNGSVVETGLIQASHKETHPPAYALMTEGSELAWEFEVEVPDDEAWEEAKARWAAFTSVLFTTNADITQKDFDWAREVVAKLTDVKRCWCPACRKFYSAINSPNPGACPAHLCEECLRVGYTMKEGALYRVAETLVGHSSQVEKNYREALAEDGSDQDHSQDDA